MNLKKCQQLIVFKATCLFLFLSIDIAVAHTPTPLEQKSIMRLIVAESLQAGVEPELALAVADVESGFHRHHTERQDIAQVMPPVPLSEQGFKPTLQDIYRGPTNIRLGVLYLRYLLIKYQDRKDLVLSHYRLGEALVADDDTLVVEPSTREYVNEVLIREQRYINHPLILSANHYGSSHYRASRIRSDLRTLSRLDDFSDPTSDINTYHPDHSRTRPITRTYQRSPSRFDNGGADAININCWENSRSRYHRRALDDFEDPNSPLCCSDRAPGW